MQKKTLIFIKKADPENPHQGEAVYIHNELAASVVTGKRKSPKVSDIRLDESTDEWCAILRDGREICRNRNRDVVVAEEAEIINGMFSRREYIPGGNNGSPLFPLNGTEESEGLYRFLGSFDGADLYALGDKVRAVSLLNGHKYCLLGAVSDGLKAVDGDWEGAVINEAVRRQLIELRIEDEEKTKQV